MRAVTILYIHMLARMTREKKLSLISIDTVCTVEHLWMWVFSFKCFCKKIYFTVNKVYSARTYSYIHTYIRVASSISWTNWHHQSYWTPYRNMAITVKGKILQCLRITAQVIFSLLSPFIFFLACFGWGHQKNVEKGEREKKRLFKQLQHKEIGKSGWLCKAFNVVKGNDKK